MQYLDSSSSVLVRWVDAYEHTSTYIQVYQIIRDTSHGLAIAVLILPAALLVLLAVVQEMRVLLVLLLVLLCS